MFCHPKEHTSRIKCQELRSSNGIDVTCRYPDASDIIASVEEHLVVDSMEIVVLMDQS